MLPFQSQFLWEFPQKFHRIPTEEKLIILLRENVTFFREKKINSFRFKVPRIYPQNFVKIGHTIFE